MDKFLTGQRVMVRKTEDGIMLAPAQPGTVRRIKINDDTAIIDLDVRVATKGVHPHPAGDRRETTVVALPEDCDPIEAFAHAQKVCHVPPAQFGRDHRTTLLYIETRCVDQNATLNNEHLRCNPARHPGQGNSAGWSGKYGTRLDDGTVLTDHDDWDCVDDLVAAGLIERHGTNLNSVFHLTAAGWKMVSELRRAKAERTFAESGFATETVAKAAAAGENCC